MREVICQDSLPWLENNKQLDSIVTSIPDIEEVQMNMTDYINFFRKSVKLCLESVKQNGYCIFLQTDRKQNGWFDKSYIITDEAQKFNYRMLWHKICLNTEIGKKNSRRPTYSHMLCFSLTGTLGKQSTPDVIEAGEVYYKNGFGINAVTFIINFLKDRGITKVVDPFVGSGTVLHIANKLGLDAIGIDIDETQCEKSRIINTDRNIANRLRPNTNTGAVKSYKDLKTLSVNEYPGFNRSGLKALDLFFLDHRLKTKAKGRISFYDILQNEDKLKHLNTKVTQYKKKELNLYKADELLRAQYSTFQLYYGSVNQFRPVIAKWIYKMLDPKIGILDFSAGWGGRCLAAMSLNIPYIGIDSNTNLQIPYKNMVELYEPTANVEMIFKPSETVDFSLYNYDLVFTSPPYFMLEKYEEMPVYSCKDEFLKKFFIPVITNAWTHLKKGGHMALNMPVKMYDSVKELLPPIKTRLVMLLANKNPNDASNGNVIGSTKKQQEEYIYVWYKI